MYELYRLTETATKAFRVLEVLVEGEWLLVCNNMLDDVVIARELKKLKPLKGYDTSRRTAPMQADSYEVTETYLIA